MVEKKVYSNAKDLIEDLNAGKIPSGTTISLDENNLKEEKKKRYGLQEVLLHPGMPYLLYLISAASLGGIILQASHAQSASGILVAILIVSFLVGYMLQHGNKKEAKENLKKK